MEKLSFDFRLSDEQKLQKQRLVNSLMNNVYLKQWLSQHRLDQDFVYDHSGKLADWCTMMEKCENCKGLDFCRQPSNGEKMDIYLDGFLMNRVTPCSFRRKRDDRYAHKHQYYEMDMLEDYLLVDVSKLDLAGEDKEYKAIVNKAVMLMMNEQTQKGLYLFGRPGAGKTYLAAGIANHYAKQKKRIAFVNTPKLIADLKMLFHDNQAMNRKLNRIKNADVVILDDIGGESVTAWSRDEVLLPILDARMEKKRLTIFTSNYSIQELRDRLSTTSNKSREPIAAERLIERICALSTENFVKGSTRRK